MWISRNSSSNRIQGFTLIEIAIGLIVLGLITIPATMAYKIYLADKVFTESSDRISTVVTALTKYAILYGHYPIPGARDLGPGDADFGQPFAGTIPDCTTGTEPICRTDVGALINPITSLPEPVLIGDLPFAEIGLPQMFITDGYKNKFTYVVTEMQTSAGTFSDGMGAITIVEKDDVTINMNLVHFAIISAGKNRKGAYSIDGVLLAPCNPPGADVENCDADAVFTNNFEIFFDGNRRSASEVPGLEYYDDYIGGSNTTRGGEWTRTANTPHIFSETGKKIRIGPGGTPDALVDVTDGDVRALQMNVTRLCNFAGCDSAVAGSPAATPAANVFDPSILGGTPQSSFADQAGGGIDCGTKGLSGIQSSDEVCSNKAPSPPPGMGSCAVGARGVDAAGALICF